MNKLKNALKKELTLSDVFIRNNEIFFVIPLIIFIISPIAELFLCSSYVEEHPLAWEFTYSAICMMAAILGLFLEITAIISFFIKNKGSIRENETLKNASIYLFILLSAIAIVSTFVMRFSEIGFSLFRSLYYFLAEFLLYFLCGSFIRKEKLKKAVIYSLLSVSFFIGIAVLLDEFVFEITMFHIYPSFSAVFYSPNYYGYFLLICVFLSAGMFLLEESKKEKWLMFASFIFNSVLLAMTNCFGVFLSAIAGFVFLLFVISVIRKKLDARPIVLLLIFLAICFVIGLKYPSFFSDVAQLFGDVEMIAEGNENAGQAGTGRWGIWMASIELIRQKPWLGWGCFGSNAEMNYLVEINAAHNEVLQYALDFGIPAAIIYVAAVFCIFYKSWKNRKIIDRMSLICLTASFVYLVSSMFGNNVYYVGPFFFIILGLSVNYDKADSQL